MIGISASIFSQRALVEENDNDQWLMINDWWGQDSELAGSQHRHAVRARQTNGGGWTGLNTQLKRLDKSIKDGSVYHHHCCVGYDIWDHVLRCASMQRMCHSASAMLETNGSLTKRPKSVTKELMNRYIKDRVFPDSGHLTALAVWNDNLAIRNKFEMYCLSWCYPGNAARLWNGYWEATEIARKLRWAVPCLLSVRGVYNSARDILCC